MTAASALKRFMVHPEFFPRALPEPMVMMLQIMQNFCKS
jgi:hypothetical protein